MTELVRVHLGLKRHWLVQAEFPEAVTAVQFLRSTLLLGTVFMAFGFLVVFVPAEGNRFSVSSCETLHLVHPLVSDSTQALVTRVLFSAALAL
jgi:hypothetical protein